MAMKMSAMTPNARAAFQELRALGASVMEWGETDGYPEQTQFVLIWANDDSSQVFADCSGNYIKEKCVDGKFINPFGFRQDVHEILKKYCLSTEWENLGQVVVYDDPDATGICHSDPWVSFNLGPVKGKKSGSKASVAKRGAPRD